MIIRSGEGGIPNVGIWKVIVERTAGIVPVEVVVRGNGSHGLGV